MTSCNVGSCQEDYLVFFPDENADILRFIQNYGDGPGATDPWLAQWTLQEIEQCDRLTFDLIASNVRILFIRPAGESLILHHGLTVLLNSHILFLGFTASQ